jgi:hypothetical protein
MKTIRITTTRPNCGHPICVSIDISWKIRTGLRVYASRDHGVQVLACVVVPRPEPCRAVDVMSAPPLRRAGKRGAEAAPSATAPTGVDGCVARPFGVSEFNEVIDRVATATFRHHEDVA